MLNRLTEPTSNNTVYARNLLCDVHVWACMHAYVFVYIYVYIRMCMCHVCVCISVLSVYIAHIQNLSSFSYVPPHQTTLGFCRVQL